MAVQAAEVRVEPRSSASDEGEEGKKGGEVENGSCTGGGRGKRLAVEDEEVQSEIEGERGRQ